MKVEPGLTDVTDMDLQTPQNNEVITPVTSVACHKMPSVQSRMSIGSYRSMLSVWGIFTFLSIFSVFSCNSLMSVFCTQSVMSMFAVNSAFSILSVNSFMALGCVNKSWKICFIADDPNAPVTQEFEIPCGDAAFPTDACTKTRWWGKTTT